MNADGLVVNGKELDPLERNREPKPDIVRVGKTKFTKEMRFNQIFPKGYMIVRDEKDKGGRELALIGLDTLMSFRDTGE